jgi:hypothetical protein
MPTEFEWRTGEESDWGHDHSQSDLWEPSPKRRRWPIFLMFLAFLTLAVIIVAFSLLNRQATREENTAVDAVIGALDLVVNAGLDGDIDLFEAMLLDRPLSFHDLQMDLFKHRLFLDRKSLGLLTTPGGSATDVISPDVSISADMEFAEIAFLQYYIAESVDGITETVQLEQTLLFQRMGDSWMLAPMPDEQSFWGIWATVKRENLNLVYPSLDEEFALRMSWDLDRLVGAICSRETILCPEEGDLRIRFDRHPSSLLRLREPYKFLGAVLPSNEFQITLPAPTLIGQPTDDVSYQALYRGYANVVASLLISQFSDQAPAMSEAYIAEELKRYGLFLPPVPFQPLARPAHPAQSPPFPFPEQDIILVCNESGSVRLLRYDLVSNTWSETLTIEDLPIPAEAIFINGAYDALAIAGDDALLIQRYRTFDSDLHFRAYLWRDGIVNLLFDEDVNYRLLSSPIQTLIDRRGRYLATFQTRYDAVSGRSIGGWLSVDQCFTGQCNLQEVPGYPYWSSDGNKTLILEENEEGPPAIMLGDAEGIPHLLLGYGISPFWLDNDTYAYIRLDPGFTSNVLRGLTLTADEIVIGKAINENDDQIEPEVALTVESLLLDIPDSSEDIGIFDVVAHPERADVWYVATTTSPTQDPGIIRVFAYERSSVKASLLYVLDSGYLGQPLIISDNGRYLYIYGVKAQAGDYEVELAVVDLSKDLSAPEIIVYPGAMSNYDWSLNEEWLVLKEDKAFRIVAPGYGYERHVPYEIPGCSSAVWLNQEN